MTTTQKSGPHNQDTCNYYCPDFALMGSYSKIRATLYRGIIIKNRIDHIHVQRVLFAVSHSPLSISPHDSCHIGISGSPLTTHVTLLHWSLRISPHDSCCTDLSGSPLMTHLFLRISPHDLCHTGLSGSPLMTHVTLVSQDLPHNSCHIHLSGSPLMTHCLSGSPLMTCVTLVS